jgi:hypothetical protein
MELGSTGHIFMKFDIVIFFDTLSSGAWGGVVVKALRY